MYGKVRNRKFTKPLHWQRENKEGETNVDVFIKHLNRILFGEMMPYGRRCNSPWPLLQIVLSKRFMTFVSASFFLYGSRPLTVV
jgi:hypothetical protein